LHCLDILTILILLIHEHIISYLCLPQLISSMFIVLSYGFLNSSKIYSEVFDFLINVIDLLIYFSDTLLIMHRNWLIFTCVLQLYWIHHYF
jgi:hypothetical protein